MKHQKCTSYFPLFIEHNSNDNPEKVTRGVDFEHFKVNQQVVDALVA
jgi:hypothetical protein